MMADDIPAGPEKIVADRKPLDSRESCCLLTAIEGLHTVHARLAECQAVLLSVRSVPNEWDWQNVNFLAESWHVTAASILCGYAR